MVKPQISYSVIGYTKTMGTYSHFPSRDARGRFVKGVYNDGNRPGHKAWNKGTPRTEKTKQKISVSRIGKPLTSGSFKKGHIPYNKGKKLPLDKGNRKSNQTSFKKGHKTWNKGLNRGPYSEDFNDLLKEEIRKRDHYRCQECGIEQTMLYRALDVHHIDGNKRNNQKDNLISHCQTCHSEKEKELRQSSF